VSETVLALARRTGGFYHGELLSGLVREVTAQGGRVIVSQTAPPSADSEDVTAADIALLGRSLATRPDSAAPAR
jgi:hypothetical protein